MAKKNLFVSVSGGENPHVDRNREFYVFRDTFNNYWEVNQGTTFVL